MAVTPGGSPYVESSDLVANYPAVSLAVAQKIDTKLNTPAAWISYTPVISGTGWALGAGSSTGAYSQMGKVVQFVVNITFGAGMTQGAGQLAISGPITRKGNFAEILVVSIVDASAAQRYHAQAIPIGSVQFALFSPLASPIGGMTAIAGASPFTWASSDAIILQGTYEAA